MSRRVALVLVGILLCTACGASTSTSDSDDVRASGLVIVTVVPDGAASMGHEPGTRWPSGSQVVVFDPSAPDARPRVLSQGLDAAGGVSVDASGARVLFVARNRPAAPFAVWTCNTDGSGLEQVVAPETDCGRAARLPDGRVVYSAALSGPPFTPGSERPWALFVVGADGGSPQRITFSAGLDLDPTVLRDGRVLFASRLADAPGRPEGGLFALLAVHPDGTGVRLFHGDPDGPRFKWLPRQLPNGDVRYVGGDTASADGMWSASWRAPLDPPESLPPVGDALPIVNGRAVDVQGLAPRPRPQGHLSMVKPELAFGRLVCIDARLVEGGGARRVRILRVDGDAVPGRGRTRSSIGEIDLEADGSFFVEVPADTPLALELLDEQGATVNQTSTPFWVRPNESRGCIGCHEPRDTAPPNVRPDAVRERPVRLGVTAVRLGAGS